MQTNRMRTGHVRTGEEAADRGTSGPGWVRADEGTHPMKPGGHAARFARAGRGVLVGVALAGLVGVVGCSSTGVGATLGGAAGAASGHGVKGAVGGAVVGGVIGHEVGKRRNDD